MNLAVIASIAYGILAIVGGIMGYRQAKSKISLIAGCSCGVLLLIAASLQVQGQHWGLLAGAIVTGVLLVAFVMRFLKTRKFMPAGLMLILGVPALGAMISQMV